MASPGPIAAYLGPAGTFTHEAASLIRTAAPSTLLPLTTALDVIAHVEANEDALGVVPIENSVEGDVTPTLDALVFGTETVYVREEIVVPVSFGAWRIPGPAPAPRIALSHPHAIAQCRGFVRARDLSVRAVDSTAEACRMVADDGDPSVVAIASARAASVYGLVPVAEHIEDHRGATTRFFVIGRHITAASGDDHTLLVVVPPDNKPGILAELLSCLASHDIDLTSAHSRPLRAELGAYCFALTLTGHVDDPNMQAAIGALCGHGAHVRFLGSFPAWKGEAPVAPFDRLPRSVTSLAELHTVLHGAREPSPPPPNM